MFNIYDRVKVIKSCLGETAIPIQITKRMDKAIGKIYTINHINVHGYNLAEFSEDNHGMMFMFPEPVLELVESVLDRKIMFDENSVGRKIVNGFGDVGKITSFDLNDNEGLPLFVEFEDGCSFWYPLSGSLMDDGGDENDTIRYYYIKHGSPDARKIVAMLAREYREYKLLQYIEEEYTTFHLYKEAKKLLGNIDE